MSSPFSLERPGLILRYLRLIPARHPPPPPPPPPLHCACRAYLQSLQRVLVPFQPHQEHIVVHKSSKNRCISGTVLRCDAGCNVNEEHPWGVSLPGKVPDHCAVTPTFSTTPQGSIDVQPMADFATWVNAAGAAADGLHNKVSGVFWWAWNANSGVNPPSTPTTSAPPHNMHIPGAISGQSQHHQQETVIEFQLLALGQSRDLLFRSRGLQAESSCSYDPSIANICQWVQHATNTV